MRDEIAINGVRLIATLDKEEATVRFFAAPFATEGGQLLTIQEWYQLAQGETARVRFRRERDALRELCRRPNESAVDHKIRLDILIDQHLGGCSDCNYDKECTACAADYKGDAHNCNCGHMPGYGWQLHEALKAARLAIKAESR